MNFKLRKVVKSNVVDYGTPDKPKMGFEQKFKMISIMKDYEDAFYKQKRKQINTYSNKQSQSMENKYYNEIILKRKSIKRLKTLKNNFKDECFKTNMNFRYNLNHMNDLYRLEKSQNLQLKSTAPFVESAYNSDAFWRTFKINDENSMKFNSNIIKNNSKDNDDKKVIYDYNNIKYKKINNAKDFINRLKCKDLIRRKISLTNNTNINSYINTTNKKDTFILSSYKTENKPIKIMENTTDDSSYIFQNEEIDDFQIMNNLKNKYKFFRKKKLDIEDIHTRYFTLLRNMLKTNPGVKLHNDVKESQKKVRRIKLRKYYKYYLSQTKK